MYPYLLDYRIYSHIFDYSSLLESFVFSISVPLPKGTHRKEFQEDINSEVKQAYWENRESEGER